MTGSDAGVYVDVAEMRDLYLALMEGGLTHTLYSGLDAIDFPRRNPLHTQFMKQLRKRGYVPVRLDPRVDRQREEGKDWPLFAQTMVGVVRLKSLRKAIETILAEQVVGDFIEAGVWRGGASIYMRGVLKAYGVTDRTVWVADSFEGLPPPDVERWPQDAKAVWHTANHLAVSLEDVTENFRRYGLLDDQVRFVKGFFRDTLPTLSEQTWSLVRLDGDMYESTMEGLTNLYPQLSPGGYIVIDDYEIENCRRAVDDFRTRENITEPLQEIDWTALFWRKPR